jgi:glycosyltransferase involved in cell wall biosynthesis
MEERTDPRVVIAHEWLTVIGGSDKTVQAMTRAFPSARVVTPIATQATLDELLPGTEVRTLWTNRLPDAQEHWRRYAPAIVAAWSALKVDDADVLVSSSHFASRAAGTRFDGTHLCYCYTPMRVAWRPDLELQRLPARWRPLVRGVLPPIRRWDRWTTRSVDAFAGISTAVVDRIREYYDRDAVVLFPPVEVDPFLAAARRPSPGYLLTFGRLIPYKRFDLAIEVATRHGYDLVVAGTGPDLARLQTQAGPSVRFEGWVDDARYRELLSGASALLFPGEEDFGIVPVEAIAAGCPVVALGRGGALDTVRDGVTGVLFPEPTVEALGAAVEVALGRRWDEAALRQAAAPFSTSRFVEEFRRFVLTHGGV